MSQSARKYQKRIDQQEPTSAPQIRRIARAVIAFAQAQREVDAEAEHRQVGTDQPVPPSRQKGTKR